MTAVSLQDNYRCCPCTIGIAKGNRRYLEQWELSKINARHQITGPGNSEH